MEKITKITLRRLRVYGSQDHYSLGPRQSPVASPIVYEACPSPDYRALLYFGALPDFVVEAEHARAAQANYILNLTFRGGLQGEREPESGIQAELARMDKSGLLSGTEYAWYTTSAIERAVEGEPQAEAIRSLEQQMLANTDAFISVAVARLAIAQGRSFYRHQVMDRVFFFLPRRSPLVVPRTRVRATVSVVTHPTSFPHDVVKTLHESAAAPHEFLSSPCGWYLESLVETDPFKAFLWAFFAMERLVSKLADHFEVMRARTDPTIQERTRALMLSAGAARKSLDLTRGTPFLKLALLLVRLNESGATERLREFQVAKRFRDQLAHGDEAHEDQLRDHTTTALAWLESLLGAAVRVLASDPATTR